MKLSEEQNRIINFKEGALLVMASAGSGKTKVLTERIKTLLSEEGGKFHVLALTFTNKAAKEMKDRLGTVSDIDKRAFIGTIHSFCQDVIENHAYAIGLNNLPQIFEKSEDRMSILIQVFEKSGNEDLKQYYIGKTPQQQQQFISNALSYISLKKKNLKGIAKFDSSDKDQNNRKIQKMYNEYNDLLNEQNAMDFDDVIINAYRIFAQRPQIAKLYRKQYKYISIDEAQDLNFAQYELLKILCNGDHKNVMMVGDTKQSLYYFNGSDVKFMKNNFIQDFSATTIELNMNYRSSRKIIEVANKINPNAMHGYNLAIEGRFNIWACEDEKEEAKKIVAEIKELLKQGKYTETNFEETIEEKDISILARNRYLFHAVEEELKNNNVSYHLKRGSNSLVLDSILLRIFDLGLRILAYPLDELHFIKIIKELKISDYKKGNNQINGFGKLESLIKFLPKESEKNFRVLLEGWRSIDDHLNFREVFDLFEQYVRDLDIDMLDDEDVVEEPFEGYLSASSSIEKEKEEVLSDIKQFQGLWALYARNTSSDLKSLQHFKTQMSLGLIIPEKEEYGITLSTIHLSKGLEFKVVFVMGMNQGSLPYYKSLRDGGVKLEEEKNIFYVRQHEPRDCCI